MIKPDQWNEVLKLLESDYSIPQAAKQTNISTTTIYRLLHNGGAKILTDKALKIPKKLVNFEDHLNLMIKKGITNAVRLYSDLKKMGYTGSYNSLNRYLNKKFPNKNYRQTNKFPFRKKRSRSLDKLSIRFETSPGKQGQVDWAYFGKIEINGKIERLYCFVYLLCWSRMRYIEFTIKQNLQTLLECHIHAFEKLGIPQEIVYDNMKAVVIGRIKISEKNEHIEYNLIFSEFAKHYNFRVRPHHPYHPQSKGKVERAIKYIRDNFWPGIKVGKGIKSLEALNKQGEYWLENDVHTKPNGTTKKRPCDRFIEERKLLKKVSDFPSYETAMIQPVYSTEDGLVEYKSNSYPIPQKFARKKLYLKIVSQKGVGIVEIYHENILIAKYYLSYERYKWIKESTAIFFKDEQKKEISKKAYRKQLLQSIVITPRPLTYYDQLILRGSLK